jgi:chemotaxis protein MotB
MDAKETEKGISVVMGEKVLFKTGMAEITTKDNSALRALSSILRETDCSIRVEGHTDDIPINNHRFSSNWELSSARAVAVVKYLIYKKGISPERLSAAGYGESRPLVPNVSESNRTLNRRVQIVLTLVNTQVDRL